MDGVTTPRRAAPFGHELNDPRRVNGMKYGLDLIYPIVYLMWLKVIYHISYISVWEIEPC